MTLKLNCIIFSVATLSAVALRSLMLLFTIDPLSGFIKNEYALPNFFITICLTTACVAVFGSTLLLKTRSRENVSVNNTAMAVSCIIMAAAMIYETFFSGLISGVSKYQFFAHGTITGFSAAVLILIAFFTFLKIKYPKIITLIPIAFWTMRLVVVFAGFSKISTISDTVIETAAMCLALATFLFYAKVECKQDDKKYRFFIATALVSSTVSATNSLPRIIAFFTEGHQPMHLNPTPVFTGIATAVFSAVFAYSLFKEIKN